MTKSQNLALELSKNRQRKNELLGMDELTDEQRSELDSLTTRSQQAEVEYRAALVAEDEGIETAQPWPSWPRNTSSASFASRRGCPSFSRW